MAEREPYYTTMTVEEWAAIEDSPTQRDTVKHYTSASRPGGHLSKPHETHRHLAMAELPPGKGKKTGKQYKLDGHSRSFGWVSGSLAPAPQTLFITVYPVKNKQEVCTYYSTFDASSATEVKRDKLFGAFRYHGFSPRHGYLFNNTGVMSCIEYCVFPPKFADLRNVPFTQMVEPWIKTIEMIDSYEFPDHTRFRSPAMLAMLMTVRVDKATALEFWTLFHNDEGTKTKTSVDGVFAASALLDLMAVENDSRWGRRMHSQYTPYFLHCYDQWHKGARMQKIDRVASRTRLMKDVITVREWWRKYLGEFDQPQIRKGLPENHAVQGELL